MTETGAEIGAPAPQNPDIKPPQVVDASQSGIPSPSAPVGTGEAPQAAISSVQEQIGQLATNQEQTINPAVPTPTTTETASVVPPIKPQRSLLEIIGGKVSSYLKGRAHNI